MGIPNDITGETNYYARGFLFCELLSVHNSALQQSESCDGAESV